MKYLEGKREFLILKDSPAFKLPILEQIIEFLSETLDSEWADGEQWSLLQICIISDER